MCEGVEMLSLKSEPGIAGMSAVITFTAHDAATSAKKVLMEGRWDWKLIHEWTTVYIVHVIWIIIHFVFEEFKKQYGLRVTISWLPWVKARPHESLPPQDLVKVSCGSSALLPYKTQMLSSSHGFCRAVGGPTAPQSPYGCSTTSLCPLGSSSSPMMLLNSICKRSGFGQPHYEISCNHAGSDGYLHFSYKVCILGMNTFKGVIMILPGDNVASTLEEARGVAAQQVLRLFHNWVCCWAEHQSSSSFPLFNAFFDFWTLSQKDLVCMFSCRNILYAWFYWYWSCFSSVLCMLVFVCCQLLILSKWDFKTKSSVSTSLWL